MTTDYNTARGCGLIVTLRGSWSAHTLCQPRRSGTNPCAKLTINGCATSKTATTDKLSNSSRRHVHSNALLSTTAKSHTSYLVAHEYMQHTQCCKHNSVSAPLVTAAREIKEVGQRAPDQCAHHPPKAPFIPTPWHKHSILCMNFFVPAQPHSAHWLNGSTV